MMYLFNCSVLITLFFAQIVLSDKLAIIMNVGDATRKLCVYDGSDGHMSNPRDKFNLKPGEVRIIACKPEGRDRCKVLNRGRGNKCSRSKNSPEYNVARNSIVHMDGPVFKVQGQRTTGTEMDAFGRGSITLRPPMCSSTCNAYDWFDNSYASANTRYKCIRNIRGCNACPSSRPALYSDCHQGHLDYDSQCVSSGSSPVLLFCNSNKKWATWLVSKCAAESDSTTLGIQLPREACYTHENIDCVYKSTDNKNYVYNCVNGNWKNKAPVDTCPISLTNSVPSGTCYVRPEFKCPYSNNGQIHNYNCIANSWIQDPTPIINDAFTENSNNICPTSLYVPTSVYNVFPGKVCTYYKSVDEKLYNYNCVDGAWIQGSILHIIGDAQPSR
eukprot:Awhi_evm1s15015